MEGFMRLTITSHKKEKEQITFYSKCNTENLLEKDYFNSSVLKIAKEGNLPTNCYITFDCDIIDDGKDIIASKRQFTAYISDDYESISFISKKEKEDNDIIIPQDLLSDVEEEIKNSVKEIMNIEKETKEDEENFSIDLGVEKVNEKQLQYNSFNIGEGSKKVIDMLTGKESQNDINSKYILEDILKYLLYSQSIDKPIVLDLRNVNGYIHGIKLNSEYMITWDKYNHINTNENVFKVENISEKRSYFGYTLLDYIFPYKADVLPINLEYPKCTVIEHNGIICISDIDENEAGYPDMIKFANILKEFVNNEMI